MGVLRGSLSSYFQVKNKFQWNSTNRKPYFFRYMIGNLIGLTWIVPIAGAAALAFTSAFGKIDTSLTGNMHLKIIMRLGMR